MSYNNQERKRNFNFSLIHAFIPIISAEHFEKSPCMAWCSYPDFLLSLFGFWRAYCILKLQSTKVSRTTTFINWLNSCCILCNFLKLSHFNWILIFLKDLNSCCLSKRPNRFSNRKGGKKKKSKKNKMPERITDKILPFFSHFTCLNTISRNDCEKDAVTVAIVNSMTSLYASIPVFSVLGFKAMTGYWDCLDRWETCISSVILWFQRLNR